MENGAYSIVHKVERTHWFFVARRRIIASLLDRFFFKANRAILLDIGGGTGGLTEITKQYGYVIGMDYSAEALTYYRQHHPVVCLSDATRLPIAAGSVDFILALDLLEHLESDSSGLAEFYRVLKPGGRALFTVPAFGFLWGQLDDLAHHYRRYTRAELCGEVRNAGFHVLKASYLNTFLFPLVALARGTEPWRKRWAKPDADLSLPPTPLNAMLASVFGIEAVWLHSVDLPFGVSVLCVVEK